MKASLACVMTLLVGATTLHAQEAKSSSDSYKTIGALMVVSHPCIVVKSEGAKILLAKDELVELSRQRAMPYHSEEERLALIAGDRAALLLESTSSMLDASGCYVSTIDRTNDKQRMDAMYLVGDLIERGQAVVLRDGFSMPESKIVIHEHNDLLSVWKSFEFGDGGLFLSLTMWIS